ncbi:MAG TPA: hypothetical protein VF711_05235 [Acidimicrobiales bacterium]|jgi:formamidopyrimidine-DNA glycosylase
MGAVVWILVGIGTITAVVWYAVWFSKLSPERKAEMRRQAEARRQQQQVAQRSKAIAEQRSKETKGTIGHRQPISKAGVRNEAGLACPRCGGAQFTAKRSVKGKTVGIATLGVGGLIAPKSQVKCVTCGAMFKRG